MERRRQNSRYADIISASSENVVIIRFIGYKVWLKGCLLKRHFRLHSHFQRSANLASSCIHRNKILQKKYLGEEELPETFDHFPSWVLRMAIISRQQNRSTLCHAVISPNRQSQNSSALLSAFPFTTCPLPLQGAFETLPHHSPPSCQSLHNPTCLEHHSLHHPVGSKV